MWVLGGDCLGDVGVCRPVQAWREHAWSAKRNSKEASVLEQREGGRKRKEVVSERYRA